jgi:hypothetical protein
MTAQFTHEGTQARTTQTAIAGSRGRISTAVHRIHLAVQEMNYASRRVVEVQAPWSTDKQWHRK